MTNVPVCKKISFFSPPREAKTDPFIIAINISLHKHTSQVRSVNRPFILI